MARFDVYRDANDGAYLLDVQATLLDRLETRVVVPLIPHDRAPDSIPALIPRFDVAGTNLAMMTPLIAAVPRSTLQDKVTDLERHRFEIVNALDFLLQGF